MSLEKSEIKRAVVHEFGATMDDALEEARKEVHLAHGAHTGLLQIAKKVQELSAHVDKDLDEGKFEAMESSLDIAKYVKVYIQRAVAVVESGAKTFEQRHLMAQGRESAFAQSVAMSKKMYDLETARINSLRQAEAEEQSGESDKSNGSGSNGRTRRVVGTHPKATVKQRRLAQEADNSLTGETTGEKKKRPKKTRKVVKNAVDS